jgi:hypothetical protein
MGVIRREAGSARRHFLGMAVMTMATAGLNLMQSAFTNWCPMMSFVRRVGVS